MLKEFRQFALKGNMVDIAVAFVIGAAFTSIVNSLVKDILTPVIGLITGGVDFSKQFVVLREGNVPGPYTTIEEASKVGAVTLNYGLFVNAVISFFIVAFVLFLVVRAMNRLQRLRAQDAPVPAPTTETCPFCKMEIPIGATRCGHCTSSLAETRG
ncbi:MAG: large conductance mechanosensitive channel protein MscL [Armatimonadota bacterium]